MRWKARMISPPASPAVALRPAWVPRLNQRANIRRLLSLDWRVDHGGPRLERVARQGLAADLAVDVAGNFWVKLEKVARVLTPLAKPSIAIRKEGTGLLDEPQLHAEIPE